MKTSQLLSYRWGNNVSEFRWCAKVTQLINGESRCTLSTTPTYCLIRPRDEHFTVNLNCNINWIKKENIRTQTWYILICLFTSPVTKKTYKVIINALLSLNQNKDSSPNQNIFHQTENKKETLLFFKSTLIVRVAIFK